MWNGDFLIIVLCKLHCKGVRDHVTNVTVCLQGKKGIFLVLACLCQEESKGKIIQYLQFAAVCLQVLK